MLFRSGPWKYIEGWQSGSWTDNASIPPPDPSHPTQLYHMHDDPGETNNVVDLHPGIAAELQTLLDQCRRAPRSVN